MTRRGLGVLGVAIAALVAMSAASAAQAASGTVTMFSDGDFIGQGVQRVFDSSRGDVISAVANQGGVDGRGSLTVVVGEGPFGDGYRLDFVAANGKPLGPGVYTGAHRIPFQEPGQPGINIWGNRHSCNSITGSFEVRDWALDASGELQRAWLIYEQHCDGPAVLFGELRLGSLGAPAAPSIVRWPETDVGHRALDVPVVTDGAEIVSAAVVGSSARDFWIVDDGCSEAGTGPCEVWVAFLPTAPGVRESRLRLTDAAGEYTDVPLQGFAYGGVSALDMASDNDPIGGGKTYHYGPEARILVTVSPTVIKASVFGTNGDYWFLDFAPAAGELLAPGTYTGAARYPFNGSSPGLNVDGNARGCSQLDGSFTIDELTFDPALMHERIVDGNTPRTFSVSFEQHCEHLAQALRGTLRLRAGDTTALAPWMISRPFEQATGSPPPSDAAVAPSDAPPPGGNVAPADEPPPDGNVEPAGTPLPPPVAGVAVPTRLDGDERVRTAIAIQGRRHAASAKAFRAATRRLRPARLAGIRTAAARLARDLRRYRAALRAATPESASAASTRRRLLHALADESNRVRAFRSALRTRDMRLLARERRRVVQALVARP